MEKIKNSYPSTTILPGVWPNTWEAGVKLPVLGKPLESHFQMPSPDQMITKKSFSLPNKHCHTLQSVLLGQVPPLYSQVASQMPAYQNMGKSDVDYQSEPMDLSCKSKPRLPSATKVNQEHSLLRDLLSCGKKIEQSALSVSPPDLNAVSHRMYSMSKVTLAKKNMLPITARVSDWLVKIVQFAKSVPDFVNLSHNDRVTLMLNSWTRLLVMFMAENNFQFTVIPLTDSEATCPNTSTPNEPTVKSVEGIQSFIKKCQTMSLDSKEYAYLRMLVLFNAGYVGLDHPTVVDRLNSLVQQLLQQHIRTSHSSDLMRFSRVLMCLPSLYGINCNMVDNLFCRHINGSMDVEVLLKEMLQSL